MTLLNGSAEIPPPSPSSSPLELNFSVFDPSPSAFSSLTSSNCTDLSLDSSPPYNFYAVLLVLLIFCVVFGNVLVCVAVSRERALQTTTNYLIVSLAVSDLLLATLVMPWGVYLEVCVRGWRWSRFHLLWQKQKLRRKSLFWKRGSFFSFSIWAHGKINKDALSIFSVSHLVDWQEINAACFSPEAKGGKISSWFERKRSKTENMTSAWSRAVRGRWCIFHPRQWNGYTTARRQFLDVHNAPLRLIHCVNLKLHENSACWSWFECNSRVSASCRHLTQITDFGLD